MKATLMLKNVKKININKLPKVEGIVKRNFKLCNLTWFKVGGEAEVYFIPKDTRDLIYFLKNLNKEIPIQILGAGSNTLIRDGGLGGVTVHLAKNFSEIDYLSSDKLFVGAGLNCTKLARECVKKSIKGFEFFSGIPGTLGGAIIMNAGAYGYETSDYLHSVNTVNRYGKIKKYFKKDIKMTYRKSSIKKDEIIINAILTFKKGNLKSINDKLKILNKKRKETQPVNLKTSGSTFKNPSKLKAWRLIKDSGCSSLKVGGARISSLHSNFIVNNGIASAKDVEELGNIIKEKVKNKFGVRLDWEIKIIGSKKKYKRYFYEKK